MPEWEFRQLQIRWVSTQTKKQRRRTVVEGRWEGEEAVVEAGREGWELVSVQPFLGRLNAQSSRFDSWTVMTTDYLLFFKRPKQDREQDGHAG
jgi:hypothetical protein